MSWGDSHRDTFAEQAEASGRADYPGEKALSATAARANHIECPVRVSVSGLQNPWMGGTVR
jgi:hypothetical protein